MSIHDMMHNREKKENSDVNSMYPKGFYYNMALITYYYG